MVVFDTAVLTLLLWDSAKAPIDPETGKPVERCKERMELLVSDLNEKRETIIIPTPVLSEVLVVTGPDGLEYVYILQRASVFRIEPFDTRAAIELAELTRTALKTGDKKDGIEAPWDKIKLDRQIVAIARVAGATTIYTNDKKLAKAAKKAEMEVVGLHELPLPAEDDQADLIKMLDQQQAEDGEPDEPSEEDIKSESSLAEAEDDGQDPGETIP